MASFKLGIAGSEYDLPTCVADELTVEREDLVEEAVMAGGYKRYNVKDAAPRTWPIEFDWLTAAEVTTLDTIAALGVTLNYINGYQGLAAGVAVVVKSWPKGATLITNTSGLATPRYRGTMVLGEVE